MKRFRQFHIVLMSILALGCNEEPEPSISQQVALDNFVNINYSATLMNAKEATRTMLLNGNLINTIIITNPNYSEIFENMEKGEYRFRLQSDGSGLSRVSSETEIVNFSKFDKVYNKQS